MTVYEKMSMEVYFKKSSIFKIFVWLFIEELRFADYVNNRQYPPIVNRMEIILEIKPTLI